MEEIDKYLMYGFGAVGSIEERFKRPYVILKGSRKIKDNKRFHELMDKIKHECLKMKVHFVAEISENIEELLLELCFDICKNLAQEPKSVSLNEVSKPMSEIERTQKVKDKISEIFKAEMKPYISFKHGAEFVVGKIVITEYRVNFDGNEIENVNEKDIFEYTLNLYKKYKSEQTNNYFNF